MKISYDVRSSWSDRRFRLEDSEGNVVKELGENPSLDELREEERKHGERIDLWQSGLTCAECGQIINGRFGATVNSDIICWDCVSSEEASDDHGFQKNVDTTKAVLSESNLHQKSLCDYVINVATGCRHGCKFCYVPTTPGYEARDEMLKNRANVEDMQSDWGSYILYRDDLPERLARQLEKKEDENWKTTDRGRGIVMLSSGTDCYQDRRAAQITRGCVQELVNRDIPVRILTRSTSVLRDIDLYSNNADLVSVGSSIPSLDDDLVKAIEPNAPPPTKRWDTLDKLQKQNVPVYVSMSPTYPTLDEYKVNNLLGHFTAIGADVVFHEPINPRGKNFEMCRRAAEDAGRVELAEKLEKLQDRENWIKYALHQIDLVQREAERYSIPVHSWPDRELVRAVDGSLKRKLSEMRKAVSAEHFSNSPEPDSAQSPLNTDF